MGIEIEYRPDTLIRRNTLFRDTGSLNYQLRGTVWTVVVAVLDVTRSRNLASSMNS